MPPLSPCKDEKASTSPPGNKNFNHIAQNPPRFKYGVAIHEEEVSKVDSDTTEVGCNYSSTRESRSPSFIIDTPIHHPIVSSDDSELSDLSDLSGMSDFGGDDDDTNKSGASNTESVKALASLSHTTDRVESYSIPGFNVSLVEAKISNIVIPRSKQPHFVPPLPQWPEEDAVKDLRECYSAQSFDSSAPVSHSVSEEEGFVEFELSDFALYLPNNRHSPFELRGLQHLGTKTGHTTYLFEGILSVGGEHRYVQDVPFKIRSIGNYGEDLHEVGSSIWIQSIFNSKSDIFYRLGRPCFEYKRYHDEFLWLADFAKHFVDYSQACEQAVFLRDFESCFSQWLRKAHGNSSVFQSWFQKFNKDDFRSAVTVNIKFLFLESMGINEDLKSHPIWSEIMNQDMILLQKIEEQSTIVTQYVYDCFKDMRFGHHLKAFDPAPLQPGRHHSLRKSASPISRGLHPNSDESKGMPTQSQAARVANSSRSPAKQKRLIEGIKVEDVLAVTKDGCGSVWKDEVSRWKAADDCWYVLVQKIHKMNDIEASYDVLWLYKPSDTACAKMKYPFPNELFLSDNCTCSKANIKADEVLGIVTVRWHGMPSDTDPSAFVRQTYLENERFVTLQDIHKKCGHLRALDTSKPQPRYPIGTTVLVPPRHKTKHGLEPYEIDSYATEGTKQLAILRRLRRRQGFDGEGKMNELVYTDQMEKTSLDKIQQTCLVRFYTESDVANGSIPVPYSRNGVGNAFYIRARLVVVKGVQSLRPIGRNIPKTLLQGFDPSAPQSRGLLNGLDLYCGGGNFGRGLEEGGAVRNKWAVDFDRNAIHTYYANLDENNPTKLFFGSVNDMLSQAMHNNPRKSDLIPLPGDIDFISAGSPCQGFSQMNQNKHTERALIQQSLVASVASYVDFYRPKYGLLENVMNMAQKGRGRDEDVMSQLICTMIGIGYQVQLFVLDAWSYGSPQSRSRLFMSFAAPGLEPMDHPNLSHSHPPNTNTRTLGKLANGQCFGARKHGPTPFEWVRAIEAVEDLPPVGDGNTYQCIADPDHVVGGGMTALTRSRMKAIPTHPRGMNLAKAYNNGNGVLTPEQRAVFPELYRANGNECLLFVSGSRAYGRVHPEYLFPCMLCSVNASEAFFGTSIHWDENRYLTVSEGRRTQGLPDNEVMVGSAKDRWKVLGNSVDRSVALSLGLSLREAWLKNDPKIYRRPVQMKTCADSTVNEKTYNQNLVTRLNETEKLDGPRRSISRGVYASIAEDSEDDEGGQSEGVFRNSPKSFPPRALMQRGESYDVIRESIATDSNTDRNKSTLKRPHVAFREVNAGLSDRSNKVRRASSSPPSPSSSARLSDPREIDTVSQRRSEDRLPFATSLVSELKKTVRERLRRHEISQFANNDESGENKEYSDSELEVISTLPSSFASSMLSNRFKARAMQTPSSGRCKMPSKPKPQHVISLLSEDEDELQQNRHRPAVTLNTNSERINQPPLPTYRSIHPPLLQKIQLPSNQTSIKFEPDHSVPNSEDEDEEVDILGTRITSEDEREKQRKARQAARKVAEKGKKTRILPPPQKYVPVDNSAFMAYMQTNRYLGRR